jgi:CSLREA domain-containing protein
MKTKLHFRFSVALSLLLMAALLVIAAPVRAASAITVNSTDDTTVAGDGSCTLREAIQNANDDALTNADCVVGSGADTITFSVSGTITLGSTLPNIADAAGLTMDGTGQTVTISGGNAVRVLMVDAIASLTLNNLTIANGNVAEDSGGGIYNSGTLTITNSAFSGNSANGWGGSGGGICNTGTLTITNSAFTGNSTGWGGSGGGIYNSGTLTITNSGFSGNSAHVWGGGGGGIYNSGTLTITNSDFSDNDATLGGGIYTSGTLTITNSTFSSNSVDDGGGGIYTSGTLTITNSTFSGNGANGGGGGIANDTGTVTITNSTFSGNTADCGGGIINTGTLTITNSALSGNRATSGGGIINFGTLTITNSTFSGNDANSGGGIVNNAGTLTITNSTFSGNTASWGAGNGGGIVNNATLTITNSAFSGNSANWAGGGIRNDGTLNYANTIIANSTSGGDCNNYYGTIGTNTNNLVEDGSCSASLSGDPNLGALADNGGPTQTFALLTGSPAIDAGDDATCSAAPVNGLDQRGIARPQGAHCDIGSYEFVDTTPPTVVSVNRASTNPTAAASVNFTVTFSESVTGVDTSDFSLTTTGVSGAAVSGVSGSGSVYTVTVNTGTGSGTLRLDLNASGTGIQDLSGNPISGGFTGGEQYAINKSSPLLLSPSNGAILHYNRPTFDWDDFLGATGYQIQVSRNAAFSLLVVNIDTAATKTDYTKAGNLPANLTLYWRARAKLGTKYSAWSSVWTLHTANPPSVPLLLTPLNGALITNSFACLDWSDSTVPTGTTFLWYEVVMSDDPNNITPITQVVGRKWCSDVLEPNKTFYWRVRSVNTDGEYSAWSLVRTFRSALLPPNPTAPPYGDNLLNNRPTFDWDDNVAGATGYTLQVSRNNTFTLLVGSYLVTPSTYTPLADLPANTLLYWRVRAKLTATTYSAWCCGWNFTTANPPSVPVLLTPLANALTTDYTPRLDWAASTVPAGTTTFDHYQVQIATDAAFSALVLERDTTPFDMADSDYTVPDLDSLAANTKYYWRVRSYNTDGEYSAWSAVRSFREAMLPPGLVSPIGGITVGSRKPVFGWGDVTGATKYTLQVSLNSAFTSLVLNLNVTASTYTPAVNLAAHKLFYWRVRATGPNGPSAWSVVETFHTL